MEEIGSGAYGVIYSIDESYLKNLQDKHHHEDDKISKNGKIAVKVIEIDDIGIHSLMEVSIMATYSHPSLINSIYIEVVDNNLRIYQEIAKYDMKMYMTTNNMYTPTNDIYPSILYDHFLEICGGVQFMHSNSIVHGDIKPQNILIIENDGIYKAKLCDFGCSTVIERNNKHCKSGTIKYNAPEVLINSTSSFSSDIWSLGCLLYEMATNKVLIPEDDNPDRSKRAMLAAKSIQMWRESEGDIIYGRLPDDDIKPIMFRLTGFMSKIVRNMTNYSPEDRPTISNIAKKIRKYTGIEDKKFKCDIKCKLIDIKVYQESKKLLEKYISRRNLTVPEHLINKASEILSISNKVTLEYLEASLLMSFKIHHGFIEHYHPVSTISDIVKAELDICVSNEFRVHKFSNNDLYIYLN